MLLLIKIVTPVLWSLFPLLKGMAVNRLYFLYETEEEKVGIRLERRMWGPSLKEVKKVEQLTNDSFIRKKAKQAIRLWWLGYSSLTISFLLILFFIMTENG